MTSGISGYSPSVHLDDMAASIAEELDGRSLATAESCTAGRLATAFAGVGSAGEWFKGGLVAYQVAVKRDLLGVLSYSVVTQHAACEMARGIRDLLRADVSVATTGVAGDEPVDGVAPGTVIYAACIEGAIKVRSKHFDGDSAAICDQAAAAALALLLGTLRQRNASERRGPTWRSATASTVENGRSRVRR